MIILSIIFCWIVFSFCHQSRNYYIGKHKEKIKNDKHYKEYLAWCDKTGNIPMNKKVFIVEVEIKENKIRNLLK